MKVCGPVPGAVSKGLRLSKPWFILVSDLAGQHPNAARKVHVRPLHRGNFVLSLIRDEKELKQGTEGPTHALAALPKGHDLLIREDAIPRDPPF
jgi:hypothetical protein